MTAVEREVAFEKHLSLHDFADVLRRRKAIALGTFLAVLAIGLLIVLTTKPLYQAKTRILVEKPSTAVAVNNAENPLSSLLLPAPSPEVDTQVEVLQSADLQQRAARRIGINPKSVSVEVRQLGKTDLAELTVNSQSSEAAEKFAATLPAVYLEDLKNNRMDAVTTGLAFARRRLTEKTAQLEKAERELRYFKSQVGVVDPAEERTQDITASASAHAAARQAVAEAAGARARLEALRATRSRLSSTITTPVTVTNPEVALLKGRIASLREERARQLFLFKPGTDEIRRVDVSIAALQNRLARTAPTLTTVTRSPNPAVAELDAKIADNMAQYRAARASWDAADANAVRLQSNLARYNSIEMRQAQLQRAIDQGRSSVEMLSKSVEEMSLRERAAAAAGAPIKIVGSAGPAEKIAPRIARSLIVISLLGLLLGCLMAFLSDSLDTRIKKEDEARAVLGWPVLGYLPASGRQSSLLAPERDVQALEDYRMLRTNVQYALAKCPERIVQVTSTLADEGKTAAAANLALVTALDNWRVILVDADTHNPRLQEIFRLEASPGLSDVLAGQSTLEAALQQTSTPNLRVLTAGSASTATPGLFNSPDMDDLLLKLSAAADFVVFDSPPCLASSDAQVLASKVDGVLYVMELGKVAQREVERSVELLKNAGAHVMGMALSNSVPFVTATYGRDSTPNSLAIRKYDDEPIFEQHLGRGKLEDSSLDRGALETRAQDTGVLAPKPLAHRGHSATPPVPGGSFVTRIAIGAGLALVAILGLQSLRSRSATPPRPTNTQIAAVADSGPQIQLMDMIGEAQRWQSTPGASAGRWQPLRADEILTTATGIRTGPESALLLQLGRAGVLRVGANTSLKIRPVRSGEYAVKLNEGKIWALAKAEPATNSLSVRTPAALVDGSNAAFSVATGYSGALTMVSTNKGNVVVRRGPRTARVAAGEAIRINRNPQTVLLVTAQHDSARNMWDVLESQESWLASGGALQLDHATVFQMVAAAGTGS